MGETDKRLKHYLEIVPAHGSAGDCEGCEADLALQATTALSFGPVWNNRTVVLCDACVDILRGALGPGKADKLVAKVRHADVADEVAQGLVDAMADWNPRDGELPATYIERIARDSGWLS